MSTNMSASLILHLGLVQTDMSLYDIIYLVTQTFIFIKIFCRDLQHVLPFNYDTPVAQWNINFAICKYRCRGRKQNYPVFPQ